MTRQLTYLGTVVYQYGSKSGELGERAVKGWLSIGVLGVMKRSVNTGAKKVIRNSWKMLKWVVKQGTECALMGWRRFGELYDMATLTGEVPARGHWIKKYYDRWIVVFLHFGVTIWTGPSKPCTLDQYCATWLTEAAPLLCMRYVCDHHNQFPYYWFCY